MRIRIRILLIIKVMRICDKWSREPPRLHSDPPRPQWLHFESLQLLIFYSDANPDTTFDFDPDPAFHVIRIQIQLSKMMWIRICNIDTDPDIQPNSHHRKKAGRTFLWLINKQGF